MKIYFDFNDWWIGYYRGSTYHFVCPLPTIVICWPRRIAQPVTTQLQALQDDGYMCGDCGHPENPFSDDTSWMCRRHRQMLNDERVTMNALRKNA